MSPTDVRSAATALFERLQSFIEEAQKLPPVNREITRITTAGAAELNTTIRGSSAYLQIADRVSDELAGPERHLSELALTFDRELDQVARTLDALETAVRASQLAGDERSFLSDIAGTLQVFITGYAATSRPGIERLADASSSAATHLPGALGSRLRGIGEHAGAILRTLDVVSSWGPRAHALGTQR